MRLVDTFTTLKAKITEKARKYPMGELLIDVKIVIEELDNTLEQLLSENSEPIAGHPIDMDDYACMCDAKDTLCSFCESDDCDQCQITRLLDNAYTEACDETEE